MLRVLCNYGVRAVHAARSFFPQYPAPLGTCLDLTTASHLAMQVMPHLLLLPSDLAPFAKLVTLSTGGVSVAGEHGYDRARELSTEKVLSLASSAELA